MNRIAPTFATPLRPLAPQRLAASSSLLADRFTPSLAGGAEKAGSALIWLMNIPVPTASHKLTDAQKAEVKRLIQPGDVLLETDNLYPGWQIAERLAFKADYTHAAMYMGNGKVIDSGSEETVAETKLDDFLDAYQIAVLRPKYQSDADRQAAFDYCRKMIGRPYDDAFDQSNDQELYCAELVYNALQKGAHPFAIPMSHPLGREIVGPDAFLRCPDIKMVWNSGSGFWKNMASHWPVPAFGLECAWLGARLGGTAGAVAGGLAGMVGMVGACDWLDPAIRHSKGKGI